MHFCTIIWVFLSSPTKFFKQIEQTDLPCQRFIDDYFHFLDNLSILDLHGLLLFHPYHQGCILLVAKTKIKS